MNPLLLEKDNNTSSLGAADLIPKLQHFFAPNISIYFLDFTLSVLVGNIFLYLAITVPNWSFAQIAYTIISSLALFRASAFMHEVFHLEKKIKGGSVYFNLLHGFLHHVPFYNYATHRYHHLPRTYGTQEDPEYDTLGDHSFFYNVIFSPFILMLPFPIFLLVRWVIIPPLLPFIGEKARLWIYQYLSTLVMNLKYIRPVPTESEKKTWYIQDACCFLYAMAILGLIISDVLPWRILLVWYFVAYLLAVMNFFRSMLNHRYATGYEATNHKQQILDSITYPLSVFNVLFYPVGLGYHALHHLFPQIPYHNLGKAHRLLMNSLPDNHPYRLTIIKSYRQGLRQLLAKQF